jgi:retinol dehydrogenase 12
VRLNATKVILACRSIEKGEAAKRSIEETTKREKVVEVWQVDLSSYESVKSFCARAQELDRLDIVVENAGIAMPRFEEAEGMESTITVNVISTFLMALLLLPKLRADALRFNMIPHLTIVGSGSHAEVAHSPPLKPAFDTEVNKAKFKEQDSASIFEALKSPDHQTDRYNVSKLIQLQIIRELAPAMTASGKPQVILNTMMPGFCISDLTRHATFPLNFFVWLGTVLIGRTTEMGSRTLVAGAEAGKDSHGMYMTDCKVSEASAWVRSEKGKEIQRKLYEELLDILESIEPGLTKNI